MVTYAPPINMDNWYPDKQDVVSWVYDIWRYLSNNPIVSEDTVQDIINNYLDTHPIDIPVKSVNGKTGNIIINYNDVGAVSEVEMAEYKQATTSNTTAIGKINDTIPTLATKAALEVTDSNVTQAINDVVDADKHAQIAETKADVAAVKATEALNKANAAYNSNNPPPYPVTSVNNKTGVINLYEVKNILLTHDAESNYYPYALDSIDYYNLLSCNVIETSNALVTVTAINYNYVSQGFFISATGDAPTNIRVLLLIARS